MRIYLENRDGSRIEFGIIYGAIAVLALIAARFLPLLALAPGCAFQELTGFPCPTCGFTRSIVHLAHWNLLPAFRMNPLAAAGFLAAILVFFYSLISLAFNRRKIAISLSPAEKDAFRIGAIAAVLLNWFYLFFAL